MAHPRRGDIVLIAGDSSSLPRSAVILQDDLFHGIDSITVCPMTTTHVEAPLLRMPIPANENTGITTDSYLMIDKITTIKTAGMREPVGHLDAVHMLELERRLIVFLGLAH